MSVFGTETEQAALDVLRDPAPAEEGTTPDGLPEEAAENTEAAEAPAEEQPAEEPAPEAQPEPEAKEEKPEPPAAEMVEKSRYEAAVREMNARQREAAESSKRLRELEQRLREMEDNALQMSFHKPMTDEEKAAYLQGLRNDPKATVIESVQPVFEKMMDMRLREERQRFDELQRKQESDNAFRDAYNALAEEWTQLKDPNNSGEVVQKMFELAETATRYNAGGPDREAWRAAPEMYLRQAVSTLYGTPTRIDQASIEAAKKRGYEEGLTQRAQREADKAKATPAAATAPEAEPQLSEEDKIKHDIMAMTMGHIFT